MEPTQVLEFIKSRRSVRKFSDEQVSDELVEMILEAGRWAPSGQNNQAWRFVIVRDPAVKKELAPLTKYGPILENASVLICTFIHKPSMYHEAKDHQAIGACCENMLMMAHGAGLGAVWLGEILKSAEEVRQVLDVSPDLELMAVMALGHPGPGDPKSSRKPLSELVVKRLEG